MKNLKKAIFLFAFIFIFTPFPKAEAYDLEANCQQAICVLSSKDPIFPPNIIWPPNEKQEKTVLIRNTDTQTKEVFLKVKREGAQGQIDPYVSLDLKVENNQVWQGTLDQFLIGQTYSMGELAASSQKELLLGAKIAQDIPNELQGGTSSFDFSFGFEENGNESESTNSNSSQSSSTNSNSSTNTPSSASLSQTLVDTVAQITTPFFSFLTGESQAQEDTLGAQTGKREREEVKAAQTKEDSASCTENPYWPLLLLMETVLLIVLGRSDKRLIPVLAILTTVTAGLGIFYLVCIKWYSLLALIPFIFYFLNTVRKNKTS